MERFLAVRLPGAQHVEAEARDHRGQPATEIADAVRVRAMEPQPGFLHRVLRFRARAEHSVGDRCQAGAVGLELLDEMVVAGHRHIPSLSCVMSMTYGGHRM
jgi:hypothetical protein